VPPSWGEEGEEEEDGTAEAAGINDDDDDDDDEARTGTLAGSSSRGLGRSTNTLRASLDGGAGVGTGRPGSAGQVNPGASRRGGRRPESARLHAKPSFRAKRPSSVAARPRGHPVLCLSASAASAPASADDTTAPPTSIVLPRARLLAVWGPPSRGSAASLADAAADADAASASMALPADRRAASGLTSARRSGPARPPADSPVFHWAADLEATRAEGRGDGGRPAVVLVGALLEGYDAGGESGPMAGAAHACDGDGEAAALLAPDGGVRGGDVSAAAAGGAVSRLAVSGEEEAASDAGEAVRAGVSQRVLGAGALWVSADGTALGGGAMPLRCPRGGGGRIGVVLAAVPVEPGTETAAAAAEAALMRGVMAASDERGSMRDVMAGTPAGAGPGFGAGERPSPITTARGGAAEGAEAATLVDVDEEDEDDAGDGGEEGAERGGEAPHRGPGGAVSPSMAGVTPAGEAVAEDWKPVDASSSRGGSAHGSDGPGGSAHGSDRSEASPAGPGDDDASSRHGRSAGPPSLSVPSPRSRASADRSRGAGGDTPTPSSADPAAADAAASSLIQRPPSPIVSPKGRHPMPRAGLATEDPRFQGGGSGADDDGTAEQREADQRYVEQREAEQREAEQREALLRRDEALGEAGREIRKLRRRCAELEATASDAEATARRLRGDGLPEARAVAAAALSGWDACGREERSERVRVLCHRLVSETSRRVAAEQRLARSGTTAEEVKGLRQRLERAQRRRKHMERAHKAQAMALREAQERGQRVQEAEAMLRGQGDLIDRLQRLLLSVAERAAAKEEVWETRLREKQADGPGDEELADAKPAGAGGDAKKGPGTPAGEGEDEEDEEAAAGDEAAPEDPAEEEDGALATGALRSGRKAATEARASALLQAREMRIGVLEDQLRDNARSFAGQMSTLRTRLLELEAEADTDDDMSGGESP